MATKTEKLSQEILDNIKTIQTEINSIIFDLGQVSVRKKEIDLENTRIDEIKKQLEINYDKQNLLFENIISDLQAKYKNAEIDLNEGVVNYEVSE